MMSILEWLLTLSTPCPTSRLIIREFSCVTSVPGQLSFATNPARPMTLAFWFAPQSRPDGSASNSLVLVTSDAAPMHAPVIIFGTTGIPRP
jgi:hypothetical protein